LLVGGLYRLALRKSATIFFQNSDDLQLFVERRLADPERARLLSGLGIDFDRFLSGPRDPAGRGPPLPARRSSVMGQWHRRYVEAARIVRRTHPSSYFNCSV